MGQQLYSVEQVADLLGLHVRTVRGYVRDGRLQAVRIGKQYRIARDDLEEFTGRPVAPLGRDAVRRTRHIDVSSIVRIDAISPDAMSRVANTLMAAAANPDRGENLRIETVYNEERAEMKIILIGGPGLTAEVLAIIETLMEER